MLFDTELTTVFLGLLKWMFVIAGSLYLVFAVVVIRQIETMKQSLVTSFSKHLSLIGFVHFGFAVLVWLFFIVRL